MYGIYNTRGCFKKLIQHEAKPSAVFALRHPPSVVYTSIGGALSVTLYSLVILLFLSTQITSIFGDQTISKLSYKL